MLIGIGVGSEYRAGPVALAANVGVPLRSVGRTDAGRVRLGLRASARL